jgi:hypothetical protein
MATIEIPKNPVIYSCELCHYFTCSKKDYTKHILTQKHIRNASATFSNSVNNLLVKKNILYCELCNKPYKDRTGLWRHKQKCNGTHKKEETRVKKEASIKEETIDKHDKLLEYLMKENKEMKELILEIVKNGTSTTNTNSYNTTNSHNKAFNLQFFLNETCKNAMNITDFVDSIKLQLSDFINVGEVGFIEGISNIIVKKLNSLDETVRPIHCTDQKRETFYLKDQNIWEKDDEEKKKMKSMIRSISYKNEKLMKVYKETYPDYNDPESHRSDHYSKIMIEAMDCKEDSRDKIIKNISKATTISQKAITST